jgi:hypothetical protein
VVLPSAENDGSPKVLGSKHGFSDMRASSCEACVVGTGGLMSGTVLSRSDRREMMSPGAMSAFGVWGSVTCASTGVAVLHHTPAKDWLTELESLYVRTLASFLFIVWRR